MDKFRLLFYRLNQNIEKDNKSMPVKLSTTLKNIDLFENKVNSDLIFPLYNYLKPNNTYKICKNGNLKTNLIYHLFIILYRKFLAFG